MGVKTSLPLWGSSRIAFSLPVLISVVYLEVECLFIYFYFSGFSLLRVRRFAVQAVKLEGFGFP